MQKVRDIGKLEEWSNQENREFVRTTNSSRKIKVKLTKNLSATILCGYKVQRTRKSEGIIQDLYTLLDPIVANTRGKCGLIETTEAIVFKSLNHHKRRSYRRFTFDVISIHHEHGQSQGPFLDKVVWMREVEAFGLFVNHLSPLTKQRNLTVLTFSNDNLRKDQALHFWLSNTSLKSNSPTTLETSRRGTIRILNEFLRMNTSFSDINLSLIHI
eukprot:TRINITY_DN13622_c0_g2_i1.p1 TRINITY_DN13622_c0_g2~~TRINITY_DN13622_c0_g2_i1.p1  ORF type:complete len:214 (+),score=2.02 TRINITY_DN13622_c0_g2_i1:38-679(+)